ncbi:sugar transferase [Aeromicrobium sp.]|uniref:sugar transferase n=1 Tax=Aeromicrobium sp. TaxID=1871063 RepID=UPI003D6A39C0
MTRPRRYDAVKRTLDVVLASVLLAVTLPVQAVVAALIRIRLGSPVLFRQDRPGLDGKTFTITKFRTMLDPRPGETPAPDEDRVTPLGQKLRSLSLDELPTLLHVVRGDMSLVGPRPLLIEYLDHYSPLQARRHEVRPGITGLAQVSGRNELSWAEKLALDVDYVDRRSLWLDLTILARTIVTVLRRSGISHDGHVTMTRFTGTTDR